MAEKTDNITTNLELQKTVKIEDSFYNINAVYSDEAGKVTKSLTVTESTTGTKNSDTSFEFNGAISRTIDYVPADGGAFRGPVHLSNPTSLPIASELINSGQIDNRIVELTGSPLCVWDTNFNPSDISNNLYMLKHGEDQAYRFTTITGTESDFYLFKDAATGVFSNSNTDLDYDFYVAGSPSAGLKVSGASRASGVVVVPEKHNFEYDGKTNEYKVSALGDGVFSQKSNITGVVIPEGIFSLGQNCFNQSKNLKYVIIPNSVKELGGTDIENRETYQNYSNRCFYGCTSLQKVLLGTGIKSIGKETFMNCTSLMNIVIPMNVTTIGKAAFSGCANLASIVLPAGLVSIADNAFINCANLKTIYYAGSEEDWDKINISSTGNNPIANAVKIYNYTYASQMAPSSPSASIDINKIGQGPFIYICKDEELPSVPVSNKVFLKLPNNDQIIEISKGAVRLENSTVASGGYYTYEGLAEIIARINLRLDALGGNELSLKNNTVMNATVHSLEDISETLEADITPEVVPTVQDLEAAIIKLSGHTVNESTTNSKINTFLNDSTFSTDKTLTKLREDLDDLTKEVEYELDLTDSIANLKPRIASLEGGNTPAGKATKLATARTIAITGGVTGTATSFDGSANISIPVTALDASKISSGTLVKERLATSGVAANTYGPTSNVTGSNTQTIKVPQITVDTYGRVTAAADKVYTSVDTTYSADAGIKLDTTNGNVFKHTNSVAAGTASGSSTSNLTFSGTFDIPSITYDAQGHITGKATTTLTLPANPNTAHTHEAGTGLELSNTSDYSAGGTSGKVKYNVKYGAVAETACEGNDTRLSDARTPVAHASQDTTYGIADASNYGHAKASSTTPKNNGTATAGTETASFARGDHVHPLQTSVSGNAGTATKFNSTRTIQLSGDVTGSATADGSNGWSITTTIADDSHNHVISNIDGLQAALDSKAGTHNHPYIPTSEKGANNGVATLGSDGKVPSDQLPSYVDDVIEYDTKESFPSTGETAKIYVAKDTNLTYRWGGTAYVEISASLAIGTTSSTAAAGNHSHGNITNVGELTTASAVVVTDTNKKIIASTNITTTELGYLDGVTSNIQDQLNSKAAAAALTAHLSANNPHGITKATLGLDTTNEVTFKKVTAESFNATSDARLKENFEALVVEKSILDLPVYKFDFINGAKNQIGCKAQDLQEICPEIVTENEDGYLSIQESKIVYLLLDEIKKLRSELEMLKEMR